MKEPPATIDGSPIYSELLSIWRALLESDALTIDDDFFESGGDSLLATELVLEIERRIAKTIPPSLLFEASTVRTLADLLAMDAALEPKPVFQITPASDRMPLVFFHGDWTNGGFYLKILTRALGAGQPLIAVAPHGCGGEAIPPTVAEMAADRLPQILSVQPQGPYLLSGHCVGAKVALETARLLIEKGEEIEAVVMIDPIWSADGRPWPECKPPWYEVSVLEIMKRTKRTLREVAKAGYLQAARRVRPEKYPLTSMELYTLALARYVPRPIPVPIVVFSSQYDGRKWHQVGSDFSLFERPGDHYDWVTIHAEQFAAQLLARVRPAKPHFKAAHAERQKQLPEGAAARGAAGAYR